MSVGVHTGPVLSLPRRRDPSRAARRRTRHVPDGPSGVGRPRRRGAPQPGDRGLRRSAVPRRAPRRGRATPRCSRRTATGCASRERRRRRPCRLRADRAPRAPSIRYPEPEHRPVTIAFVEASGTDHISPTAGPRGWRLRSQISFRRYKGRPGDTRSRSRESDVGADAVKILLVGGAPDTTGSNEDRVLLAARAAIEHNGPLSVRVGINRGRVFTGILRAAIPPDVLRQGRCREPCRARHGSRCSGPGAGNGGRL